MRLLHFEKQNDLVLTEYHDDPPPYAVFVQRRGPPKEEITFQDLQTRQGQSKPGYRKILSFGRQAQRHGLTYFWVSTCCIDKANSVELWTTLESMSNLLLNARRCYVHYAALAGFLAVVALELFGGSWVPQSRRQKQLEFFLPELESIKTRASLEQMIRKGIYLRFGSLPESSTLDFSIDWRTTEPVLIDKDNQQNPNIAFTEKYNWKHAIAPPTWFPVRDNPPQWSPSRDKLSTLLSTIDSLARMNDISDLLLPFPYDGWQHSTFTPLQTKSPGSLQVYGTRKLRGLRENIRSNLLLPFPYDGWQHSTFTPLQTESPGSLQVYGIRKLRGLRELRRLQVLQKLRELQELRGILELRGLLEFHDFEVPPDVEFYSPMYTNKVVSHYFPVLRHVDYSSYIGADYWSDLYLDYLFNSFIRRERKESEFKGDEDAKLELLDGRSAVPDTVLFMSSVSPKEMKVLRESGIREITGAFLGHSNFKSLYTAATNNVIARKSRVHLRELLSNYCHHLDKEARTLLQRKAAGFIRQVAGRIAREIILSTTGFERERIKETTTEEKQNLEKWLSTSRHGRNDDLQYSLLSARNDPDGNESEDNLKTFPNIDAAKDFLLSSKAFEILLRAFDDWINFNKLLSSPKVYLPDPTPGHRETTTSSGSVSTNDAISADDLAASSSNEDGALPPNSWGNGSLLSPKSKADDFLFLIWRILDFWGVAFSSSNLMNLFISSPLPGRERIIWRCTCNTVLWGDFPADDPHALAQLKEDLPKYVSTVLNSSGNDIFEIGPTKQFSKMHGQQQSPSHQGPGGVDNTPHSTTTSGGESSSSFVGRQGDPLVPSSQDSLSDQPSIALTEVTVDRGKPVYFEVCTNNGNSAVGHFELDITQTTTDGEIFGKIWKIYNQNRWFGINRWFLLPCDVHFVLFSISTMKSARYSAGIHGKPAEFPPDVELENGRYVYQKPKIVMPSHLFIHYLYRGRSNNADDHPGNSWLKRLPKKLNDSMLAVQAAEASPDSDLVFGWGVHILDGPNHAALGFLLAVGIAITFVISFLILGIEKTEEQAFGVGSYLIAIVVALMSAVYFKLQDQ